MQQYSILCHDKGSHPTNGFIHHTAAYIDVASYQDLLASVSQYKYTNAARDREVVIFAIPYMKVGQSFTPINTLVQYDNSKWGRGNSHSPESMDDTYVARGAAVGTKCMFDRIAPGAKTGGTATPPEFILGTLKHSQGRAGFTVNPEHFRNMSEQDQRAFIKRTIDNGHVLEISHRVEIAKTEEQSNMADNDPTKLRQITDGVLERLVADLEKLARK